MNALNHKPALPGVQGAPWTQEKNRTLFSGTLGAIPDNALADAIAEALLNRLGRHEAANVLFRAERLVRGAP